MAMSRAFQHVHAAEQTIGLSLAISMSPTRMIF
jgi:hypothetical protein